MQTHAKKIEILINSQKQKINLKVDDNLKEDCVAGPKNVLIVTTSLSARTH